MNDSIEDIKKYREVLKEAFTNSDDVKEGISTAEEETEEPIYKLYDGIAECVIKILQSESIQMEFQKLSAASSVSDANFISSLIELLAIIMTHSAYNAVVWYDTLLKKELDKAFENYGNAVNNIGATTQGIENAMKVFKKRITDLEKKAQIEDITKN